MKKFEQLIEYVINDEEDKARELFHEIVVEKSKDIYEEILAEEEIEESEEEVTEADDAEEDEAIEESELGGSQVDELIDEIEADEQGVAEADDEEIEMIDMDDEGDEGDAEDLEDRVVNVEDKLDELMAEFEELMAQVDDNEEDIEAAHSDEEVDVDVDMDMDDEEPMEGMLEGVDLKAAPKPVTSEEGSVNKKSAVAANSGAKGAVAKPVDTDTAAEGGRPAPKAQDMGGTTAPDEKPAPKADNSQAAGVNTKSPVGSK